MAELTRVKTYGYEDATGWKRYRALCIGRGMYHDVKRRLPYYWSDIVDGYSYRTFSGTIRIYFVNLLPAIAFILDMERRTHGFYSINEGLLASALAAFVFSVFSCQPITIVGITGLISLFNYTIYDIVAKHDTSLYPQVMAWTGIWAAIFHWLFAFCNTSDYMRYVTDFSSQSFGAYVGIIYIIKGVEEAIAIFDYGLEAGYLGIVIGILFTLTIYGLENGIGGSTLWQPWIRGVLSDYAYPIATIFWTGFSHIPGRIKNAATPGLPTDVPAFYTTDPQFDHPAWYIPFWELSAKWVFVAMPLGFLTMLLFYFDHNISSITAQAKQFPLKKPGGFHWDFFLLGITTFLGGVMGFPFPNGLVPQAPVHTDALTTYETNLKKFKSDDDALDNDAEEQVSYPRPKVDAVKVEEQRVSHFLMCLALCGTMTGPLLIVLGTIPRALFVGVFFVVGWGSIESNAIVHKLLFLMKERRFIASDEPLLRVPRLQIVHFISWQIFIVGSCVAISQTIGAIGFPLLMIALIPIRWKLFPRWFTADQLSAMDALTANSDVVLASLGGKPEMPELKMQTSKRVGDSRNADVESQDTSKTVSNDASDDENESKRRRNNESESKNNPTKDVEKITDTNEVPR